MRAESRSGAVGQKLKVANQCEDMPPLEERTLRVLGEAREPLFASEITERLNHELRPDAAYTTTEIAGRLKKDDRTSRPVARWAMDAQTTDALNVREKATMPSRGYRLAAN